MHALVTHRALAGTPWLFSLDKTAGITRALAGLNRDSAESRVQAKRAPPTEIIRPRLIIIAPQGPAMACNTPAVEGFFMAASSGWPRMPSDSSETEISSNKVMAKPMMVARPTLTRSAARAE